MIIFLYNFCITYFLYSLFSRIRRIMYEYILWCLCTVGYGGVRSRSSSHHPPLPFASGSLLYAPPQVTTTLPPSLTHLHPCHHSSPLTLPCLPPHHHHSSPLTPPSLLPLLPSHPSLPPSPPLLLPPFPPPSLTPYRPPPPFLPLPFPPVQPSLTYPYPPLHPNLPFPFLAF